MKDEEFKGPPPSQIDVPQGDGFGAVTKPRNRRRWKRKKAYMRVAKTRATKAATKILECFPHDVLLSRKDKDRIVAVFRRVLFPPRKAGRPQSPTVTCAWQDWKNGVKHSTLYLRHIPGYESLSPAERALEARKLMSAVRKRQRRADAELGLPLTPSP